MISGNAWQQEYKHINKTFHNHKKIAIMSDEQKKTVSREALEAALQVIMKNMPGIASSVKAGLIKPGKGLQIDTDGTVKVVLEGIEVDPGNIASASKTGKGVMQVGAGLNVESGVVSVDNTNIDNRAQAKIDALKLKTINGQTIRGEGDIKIDLSLFKVVDALPETDIDDNKIYLLANTETVPAGELNKYVEYIHTPDGWEKIGEFKTSIDLTPYAKKTDLGSYMPRPSVEMNDYSSEIEAWAAWVGNLDSGIELDSFISMIDKIVSRDESVLESIYAKQSDLPDLTPINNKISNLETATSDAELKKKYPILTKEVYTKAEADSTFVKASELEAMCMTAADGKALAESIFGTQA